MCGICGFVDYSMNSLAGEESLHRMCAQLKHRGPDDEGVIIYRADNTFVGLGHRRLSIIDLSASGHQPMSNEDGTVFIVCNGEIYNYKVLRAELENKGHKFKSYTDTETIVHLYEEYTEDCVKYLRGMFAFAIWDKRRRTLLLARDRVGKKPLLYYHKNNKFVFASEFLAILASNLTDNEIKSEALDYYLSFGYIPAPLTIYKNIFKLLPAHMLILKDNKFILKKYWELDYYNKLNVSKQDAAEEILRLLKEAVKIRLYSDVPLGAFLSGGIDSSTVVGLMAQLSDKKVKTFSIGFEEKDYSELSYARNIAERFATEHHEFIVRPKALEVLPLLVERYGEPYADSSCIPTYYVSRQTKQYVTVALNGDGGDESFAGYERYQAMLFAQYYQNLPAFTRRIINGIVTALPVCGNHKNKLGRVKRFFAGADFPVGERYLRWVCVFDEGLKKSIYSENFLNSFAGSGPVEWLFSYVGLNSLSLADKLLKTDVNTYLPNDLLVKMDIASMANALETRSPFLDHKLMEFCAKLPAEYKLSGFVKKHILKKAVKDLLPRENIYRRKMGFGVPVGEWFRNDLNTFLNETLLSKKSLSRGYFKPEAIKNIVERHVSRKEDYSLQLWALFVLELWHQRFVD